MRKVEQQLVNDLVMSHLDKAWSELPKEAFSYLSATQLRKAGAKRLRSCTAWVWETDNYYVLQSYETFVAVIEKATDTCYDALRIIYGYTATSASHIAKFRKSTAFGGYSTSKWECEHILTARN